MFKKENTQKKKVKLQVEVQNLWGKTRDGTKTCP